MKKYLALLLAVLMLTAMFAGCASKETTTDTPAASTETAEPTKTEETKTEEPAAEEAPASEEGKVFNIYAWNEEFKGFFEKYYTVPEGVTVNWIITPSADGAYQDKLDEALLNQESASADDKVDLFLAEADYIGSTAGIIKYAEESDASEFIIVTVRGVLYELERRCQGTGKKFYFPAVQPTCVNMDLITLEKLVRCLETGEGEVQIGVSDEAADQAKLTLDRMLEYAAR